LRSTTKVALTLATVAGLSLGVIGLNRRTAGQTPKDLAWEVSGLWSEACGCALPCPCWFGKKPTLDHCENIQVFRIEKGHYGQTPLNGLVVVVAWVSAPGKIMDKSAAESRLLAYYLDRSATPAQRRALKKIWDDSIMAGVKSPQGGVKIVSLKDVEIRPGRATVTIPGILSYSVYALKDRPVKIYDPVRSGFEQGLSRIMRYKDYGVEVSYSGRHAFFATFKAKSS
jgi:hypothetical protein